MNHETDQALLSPIWPRFTHRTLEVVPLNALARMQRRNFMVRFGLIATCLCAGWLTPLLVWFGDLRLTNQAHFVIVSYAVIGTFALFKTRDWLWTRPLTADEGRVLAAQMSVYAEAREFVDAVKLQRQITVFDLWVVGAWLADKATRETTTPAHSQP